jgi:hypothetical protein
MDLFGQIIDAIVIFSFGVILGTSALQVLRKHGSVLGMVPWLSIGVAFTVLGLLVLAGFIGPEWRTGSRMVVMGAMMTWWSLRALYSAPTPNFPRWVQWACLALGLVFMLFAIVDVVINYRA